MNENATDQNTADQADGEAYYAGTANTTADDRGFMINLDDDDESQIEASEPNANGVTLALGHLGGRKGVAVWGQVVIDWQAAQVLADELNAMLRQARVENWT